MTQTLIIFSRYPEAGKTKTRMIPALGAEGAAQLQKRLSEHTLKQARQFRELTGVTIKVYFAGGTKEKMATWLGEDISYTPQATGDLGLKMRSAFRDNGQGVGNSVVIIGIDCPGIDATVLQAAFDSLTNHDLVLGKAADGGYYLIGLKVDSSSEFAPPELFSDINWGTEEVFAKTIAIAKKLKLTAKVLPVLRDMDRPEDLDLLELLEL